MRVIVVGASSGLGRCIAVGLAQRGAQVALMARRRERLVAAAEEAGNGAVAIACDRPGPIALGQLVLEAAYHVAVAVAEDGWPFWIFDA